MIIAVVNQKGGVGKTTVAVNLANRLAQNARVLLVDCDPQGDATSTCGVEVTGDMPTLNDVLATIAGGASASAVTRKAIVSAGAEWGFDIIPSNRALASRETDTALGREFRLQNALEALTGAYEHIVLDCPPSLGMMTSNALVAADMAVVVTHPRETATNGVAEVFNTIHAVRGLYNPKLQKIAIVINEHIKARTNVTEWVEALSEYYGDYLIEDMLPKHEHIARANSDHKPIEAGKEECVDNVFAQLTEKCQQ
ncbi:MAG: ParA family protein [Actinomycetaceae bacterium]|nr:ParA family protein [Actinomycetaceae bacterium]